MKRTPYLMMLTQRLMMIMAGAQPALEWALRRQTCDYWNRPITEPKEQGITQKSGYFLNTIYTYIYCIQLFLLFTEDGEKMFFNITG